MSKWIEEGIVDDKVSNPDNIPFDETRQYIKKVTINRKVYEILNKITEYTDKIKISGRTK